MEKIISEEEILKKEIIFRGNEIYITTGVYDDVNLMLHTEKCFKDVEKLAMACYKLSEHNAYRLVSAVHSNYKLLKVV